MNVRLKSALLYALAMTVVAVAYPAQQVMIPFQAVIALVAIFFCALIGFSIGSLYLHTGPYHFALKVLIYPLLVAFCSIFAASLTCAVTYPLWRHLEPHIGDLPDLGLWIFSSAMVIAIGFLQDMRPPTLPLLIAAGVVLAWISKPASNNSFKPRPLRGSA